MARTLLRPGALPKPPAVRETRRAERPANAGRAHGAIRRAARRPEANARHGPHPHPLSAGLPLGRRDLGAPGRGRQPRERLVALRAAAGRHPRRRRERRRLPPLGALRRGLRARARLRPHAAPALARVEPHRARARPPRRGGDRALPRGLRLAPAPRPHAARDAPPLHQSPVDRRRRRLGVALDARPLRRLRALLRARVRRRGGLVVHGERARGRRLPRLQRGRLAPGTPRRRAGRSA